MSIIVTKFGGSSLADASQFKKVKEIITSNPDRKKRNSFLIDIASKNVNATASKVCHHLTTTLHPFRKGSGNTLCNPVKYIPRGFVVEFCL